jgi:hypothetical protein
VLNKKIREKGEKLEYIFEAGNKIASIGGRTIFKYVIHID